MVPTVWELGDEYEYIWNASYLSGDSLLNVYDGFYGIGYSLFLILPLKFISSGAELIKACYILNLLFVLGTYVLINAVLAELNNNIKALYPVIAFTGCVMPYVISNAYKTICEDCFLFFFCLSIFLTIKLRKTSQFIYAFLASICLAFLYLVHIRALIIIACYFLYIIWITIENQNKNAHLYIFLLISLIILICLCHVAKSNVISYKQLNVANLSENQTIKNTIDESFIIERIRWFLNGIEDYAFCFCGKIYYSFYITAGLVFVWIDIGGKRISDAIKNKKRIGFRDEVFVLLVFIYFAMLVSITMTGTGADLAYAFYGRYYEFIFVLIVCLTLDDLTKGEFSPNKRFVFLFLVLEIFIQKETMAWVKSFIKETNIRPDTNRLNALTNLIEYDPNNVKVVFLMGVITVILLLLLLKLSGKNDYILIAVLIVFFLRVSIANVNEISQVHDKSSKDYEVAEYISEKLGKGEKIYFINDSSYKYDDFYSRMVVLLYGYDFEMIKTDNCSTAFDNIPEDTLFLIYNTSKSYEECAESKSLIMEGNSVLLFKNNIN